MIIEETSCLSVSTIPLVVKHSTVVTGLVAVWVSLTIDVKLLDCDASKILCCLWGEQFTIFVEEKDDATKPTYTDKAHHTCKVQLYI